MSPTLTSSGMISPVCSERRPGPTARTSPCWGFSLAVSGMTRPLAVVSSASPGLTTMRSSSGCRFMSGRLRWRVHARDRRALALCMVRVLTLGARPIGTRNRASADVASLGAAGRLEPTVGEPQVGVGAGVEGRRAVALQPVPGRRRRPWRRCRCTSPGWAGTPRRPSSTQASRNRSRSSELAATPPPRQRPLAPTSRGGPPGLGDEHVDHGLLERGGHVGGVDLGVLADVVDDRRLEPAEGEVVGRRRASPAGSAMASGSPSTASRSMAGPPG